MVRLYSIGTRQSFYLVIVSTAFFITGTTIKPVGMDSHTIERIYVLKEFHGKNVGQILYEKAMQIARQSNANYVWLGVWEENARAINFYKKNGFVEFEKHIFKLGNDEQTDIMMKLQLKDK
jgi:ribosomal protein S18 acetylase RimI-like enzyme